VSVHIGSGTHPSEYAMRSDRLSDHANYPMHRPAPSAHRAWYWGLCHGDAIKPSI